MGCATMSTINELKFKRHDLILKCFSATKMEVTYRHQRLGGGGWDGKMQRAKRPEDDKSVSGVIMFFRAFETPLKVEWRSLDGTEHSIFLDLDEIFKNRIVLHNEDPERVDPVNTRDPIIVVEVNNRTISLYMDVDVALYPTESSPRKLNRHRTLVYSKTL